MGNKNEGYLGGIMGGESRVESGGGGLKSTGILSLEEAGTQVVTPSNTVNASGLTLTDGLTLVSGTEVDHIGTGGLNGYEDAYITLPTGSGYVYAEVHMFAANETFLHQAVGLIKSASVDTNDFGHTAQANAVTVRRASTSHYRHVGGTTLVPQTVSGRDAVNTYHFLVNRDNGNVWIGITPEGSTTRWIRSDDTMDSSWSSSHPTFVGLNLSTYDTFYFQQYYTTQSAWVNFGGNPLFNGQLSSGNDSGTWFRDPDASVSAASLGSEAATGPAETLTLPQLSWGGITGRSVLTEGSAPLAVDTVATFDPDFSTSVARSLSQGDLWLTSNLSNFSPTGSTQPMSSGKYYAEFLAGDSNLRNAFGVCEGNYSFGSTDRSYTGSLNNACMFATDGRIFANGTQQASPSFSGVTHNSTVIGVALDLDSATKTVKWYLDGTLHHTYTLTSPSSMRFCVGDISGSYTAIFKANFGQDHTFASTKTALATPYTDANGLGEFYYQPPAGYVGLYTTTGGSAATEWTPSDLSFNPHSWIKADEGISNAGDGGTASVNAGWSDTDGTQNGLATKVNSGTTSATYINLPSSTNINTTFALVKGDAAWVSRAYATMFSDATAYDHHGDDPYQGDSVTNVVDYLHTTVETWRHTRENGEQIDWVSGDWGTKTTSWRLYSLQSSANDPWEFDRFGNDRSNAGRNFTGELAELLTFEEELTEAEIEKIEGYLMHKWGLESNLPASHPYKASAPSGSPATSQSLVNTGIFTLEEIYELTKSA